MPAHAIALITRLFEHAAWADATIGRALAALPAPPAEAVREYAHVVGAEETWLARLEARPPQLPVWPEAGVADTIGKAARVADGYRVLIAALDAATLDQPVAYTNSAGREFATPRGDILMHVALHGQYHRGKVNLLLRQAGATPAPTDFIAFARGVPAATQGDPRAR